MNSLFILLVSWLMDMLKRNGRYDRAGVFVKGIMTDSVPFGGAGSCVVYRGRCLG